MGVTDDEGADRLHAVIRHKKLEHDIHEVNAFQKLNMGLAQPNDTASGSIS